MSTTEKNVIKVKRMDAPILIKKNNKFTLMKGINSNMLLNNKTETPMLKEDIIYQSKAGDFLVGDSLTQITIVNHLDLATNSSRTLAKYVSSITNEVSEKTSDNVTTLIGQKNYDTVFSALCSVISHELKIRGILALLTSQRKLEATAFKPDFEVKSEKRDTLDQCCQTEETSMDLILKFKQRKRIVKRATPYVVKDDKKKLVIYPESCRPSKVHNNIDIDMEIVTDQSEIDLPEIKPDFDEDTDDNMSTSSISGATAIYENTAAFLNTLVNKYTTSAPTESLHPENEYIKKEFEFKQHSSDNTNTEPSQLLHQNEEYITTELQPSVLSSNHVYITVLDGSKIMVPVKPEDKFHYATPEILNNVTNEEKQKLRWYQAYIDWKFCLERDEEGNLPIHLAVINKDLDWLRRQCLVLRNRQKSLDIPAGTFSALKMAVLHEAAACVATLLKYGADPLLTDDEHRTALHHAAETPTPDVLEAIINYCRECPAQVLEEHEELWRSEMADMPKEALGQHLLDKICQMIDGQGYTALMLASKLGLHEHARLLVAAAPAAVDLPAPICGNTALYQAVKAACLSDRLNKSKVEDHYIKTIEVLLAHGANPAVQNYSGSNVNDLLTEAGITELSMLISNNLSCVKMFNAANTTSPKHFRDLMLFKDDRGNLDVQKLKKNEKKHVKSNTKATNNTGKSKPKILENISLPTIPPGVKIKVPMQKLNVKEYNIVKPKDLLVKSKPLPKSLIKCNQTASVNLKEDVSNTNLGKQSGSVNAVSSKTAPSKGSKHVQNCTQVKNNTNTEVTSASIQNASIKSSDSVTVQNNLYIMSNLCRKKKKDFVIVKSKKRTSSSGKNLSKNNAMSNSNDVSDTNEMSNEIFLATNEVSIKNEMPDDSDDDPLRLDTKVGKRKSVLVAGPSSKKHKNV